MEPMYYIGLDVHKRAIAQKCLAIVRAEFREDGCQEGDQFARDFPPSRLRPPTHISASYLAITSRFCRQAQFGFFKLPLSFFPFQKPRAS